MFAEPPGRGGRWGDRAQHMPRYVRRAPLKPNEEMAALRTWPIQTPTKRGWQIKQLREVTLLQKGALIGPTAGGKVGAAQLLIQTH